MLAFWRESELGLIYFAMAGGDLEFFSFLLCFLLSRAWTIVAAVDNRDRDSGSVRREVGSDPAGSGGSSSIDTGELRHIVAEVRE